MTKKKKKNEGKKTKKDSYVSPTVEFTGCEKLKENKKYKIDGGVY